MIVTSRIKPGLWNVEPGLLAPKWRDLRTHLAYEWLMTEGSGTRIRNTGYMGPAFDGLADASDPPIWSIGNHGPVSYHDSAADRRWEIQNFDPPLEGSVEVLLFVNSLSRQRVLGFSDAWEFQVALDDASIGWTNDFFTAGVPLTTGIIGTDSRWYHYVGTWAHDAGGGPTAIYVDGILRAFDAALADDDPGSGELSIGARTGATFDFEGFLSYVRVYDRALREDEVAALYADPFGIDQMPISPASVAAAAGGQTVVVGLAAESDTAFGLAASKDRAVGLASEADSPLALTAQKTLTVGLAQESDAAFALSRLKSLATGLAQESDTGFSLSQLKSLAAGPAQETDTGFGVGSAKLVSIGLSQEADSALTVSSVTGVPVGLASESDVALALTIAKALSAGLASEADTGLAVTALKDLVVGLANETDSGLAVTVDRALGVGLALETDTGLVIVPLKALSVGLAQETDTALAVVIVGQILGLVLQVSVSQALALAVSTTSSLDVALDAVPEE